jgi:GT2 family glycosyltransferase
MSAVTAACLVVRKELYQAVGGMDENLAIAFNDVDFCMKLRAAGYRNVYTPYAELFHHESVSRGAEDTAQKQARFKKEIAYMRAKWGTALRSDPFYNPNLTLEAEDFSLAWPPRVAFPTGTAPRQR